MNRPAIHYYLCVLFLCAISACSQGEAVVYSGKADMPSREELRRAMRYHGIMSAERDEDGQWYFLRDGKRCALFGFSQLAARDGQATDSKNN